MPRIHRHIVRVPRDQLPDGALFVSDSKRTLVIVGDHQLTADLCAQLNATFDAAALTPAI